MRWWEGHFSLLTEFIFGSPTGDQCVFRRLVARGPHMAMALLSFCLLLSLMYHVFTGTQRGRITLLSRFVIERLRACPSIFQSNSRRPRVDYILQARSSALPPPAAPPSARRTGIAHVRNSSARGNAWKGSGLTTPDANFAGEEAQCSAAFASARYCCCGR